MALSKREFPATSARRLAKRGAACEHLGMTKSAFPLILASGEGYKSHAFGEEVTVHLDRAQTGGRTALWTEITPPGVGPSPHYQQNEDELFLVQEGSVALLYDEKWHEVAPGAVVFMPKPSVHPFKDPGEVPSRMLVQGILAGFERFFARCAEEFPGRVNPACSGSARLLRSRAFIS
jgi:uncharacterized cupin superfamily protein